MGYKILTLGNPSAVNLINKNIKLLKESTITIKNDGGYVNGYIEIQGNEVLLFGKHIENGYQLYCSYNNYMFMLSIFEQPKDFRTVISVARMNVISPVDSNFEIQGIVETKSTNIDLTESENEYFENAIFEKYKNILTDPIDNNRVMLQLFNLIQTNDFNLTDKAYYYRENFLNDISQTKAIRGYKIPAFSMLKDLLIKLEEYKNRDKKQDDLSIIIDNLLQEQMLLKGVKTDYQTYSTIYHMLYTSINNSKLFGIPADIALLLYISNNPQVSYLTEGTEYYTALNLLNICNQNPKKYLNTIELFEYSCDLKLSPKFVVNKFAEQFERKPCNDITLHAMYKVYKQLYKNYEMQGSVKILMDFMNKFVQSENVNNNVEIGLVS